MLRVLSLQAATHQSSPRGRGSSLNGKIGLIALKDHRIRKIPSKLCRSIKYHRKNATSSGYSILSRLEQTPSPPSSSSPRTLLTSTPAPTPYAAGAALAAHRSHLRRSCAAPARDSARSSRTPELAAMGTRACQCPRLPPCLYVAQCHACAYVYVQANKCTSTCRQRS